jgi:hypothetical protein
MTSDFILIDLIFTARGWFWNTTTLNDTVEFSPDHIIVRGALSLKNARGWAFDQINVSF